METGMHRTTPKVRRFASALLAAGVLAAVGAGSASAATTHYTTEYTSEYGKVLCTGRLVVNSKYPGNATEGGKEVERCISQEPNGKLTGYFTPGEEYTGYWESDYYATIGQPGVHPSSVLIKVAKNFKSFRVVSAVYPVKEA
jgi:hypothetical protein